MSAANTSLPLNPIALRLGHLGLVPFVLGAALVWLLWGNEAHPYVTMGLSAYAATVVAFLGGIHWGLGFRQNIPSPAPYIWGVFPSLMAWVGVMMPPHAGLVVHGVRLVVCYMMDRRTYPALGASAWLTLRFRLSAVAALCCFLGAAGS